jgi:hypothetical protein
MNELPASIQNYGFYILQSILLGRFPPPLFEIEEIGFNKIGPRNQLTDWHAGWLLRRRRTRVLMMRDPLIY